MLEKMVKSEVSVATVSQGGVAVLELNLGRKCSNLCSVKKLPGDFGPVVVRIKGQKELYPELVGRRALSQYEK